MRSVCNVTAAIWMSSGQVANRVRTTTEHPARVGLIPIYPGPSKANR